MGELNLRIAESFDGLDSMREEWDEAVAALGGAIYMSYDWSKTWWKHYGIRKKLRVFLFYAGEKIVGIVPIYIDCIGIRPVQLVVARLVGANIPPKAFKAPVHSRYAKSIFNAILEQLLNRDGCDLVGIGPLCETTELLLHFETAARERKDLASSVKRRREGIHTVFKIPATLKEFFAAMDKDERKKRQYEMRLLMREEGVIKDVLTTPEETESEFDSFVRLHALQWRDKGKLGHFGSWPKSGGYNLALVKALSKLDRVRFVRILSSGDVISSQYAFVFGDTCYWELPARVMDRQWNRFSLGTNGFFALLEEAIKEGKTRIEGGLAHYDYKQKLNGTEFKLEVLRVVANRYGSNVRALFFRIVRWFLLWAYYKIWYSRLSPRLPAFFRRPIWEFWLRLDF